MLSWSLLTARLRPCWRAIAQREHARRLWRSRIHRYNDIIQSPWERDHWADTWSDRIGTEDFLEPG
jgi:hypothetical protein